MADNTAIGVIGIVLIVAITGAFLWGGSTDATITGNVAAEPVAEPTKTGCEPARYCSGSKVLMIREDCSIAQAYCDAGCVRGQGVCA